MTQTGHDNVRFELLSGQHVRFELLTPSFPIRLFHVLHSQGGHQRGLSTFVKFADPFRKSMPRSALLRTSACVVAAAVGGTSAIQGGINTYLSRIFVGNHGRAPWQGNVTAHSGEASCVFAPVLFAALVSFTGGVATLLLLNVSTDLWRYRKSATIMPKPPRRLWEVTGGLLGSSIMVMILVSLSLVGFALVAVLRAAGTAMASLMFDQVGCIGSPVRRVNCRRAVGMLLLLSGSALSAAHELTEEITHASLALLLASALPLVAGALLPVQAAANGQLAKHLGGPLRATLVSFVGGTLCLAMAVGVCGTPTGADQWANAPWWAFTGGLLGMLTVTANFILPPIIGYATQGGFTMFGNLASSMVLDAIGGFGFVQRPPTVLRSGGVALAFVGAALTRQRNEAAAKPLLGDAASTNAIPCSTETSSTHDDATCDLVVAEPFMHEAELVATASGALGGDPISRHIAAG